MNSNPLPWQGMTRTELGFENEVPKEVCRNLLKFCSHVEYGQHITSLRTLPISESWVCPRNWAGKPKSQTDTVLQSPKVTHNCYYTASTRCFPVSMPNKLSQRPAKLEPERLGKKKNRYPPLSHPNPKPQAKALNPKNPKACKQS